MTTITDDDKYRFTHGGCLILADKICQATGWPLYAFTSEDSEEPQDHAFVRTPDRKYLDVEGLHTEDELLEEYSRWGVSGVTEFYLEDFDECWWRPEDLGPESFYHQRGDEIVPELLALASQLVG